MSAPTTNIPVAIPAGGSSRAPGSQPGATGQGGQGARTIAGSIPGARGIAGRLLHGTPGRMRLFGLLGVIAAVLLGAVSANALLASQAAVERAANNTAQVVRAQSIHVDLLRADAVATNAFLVGGLESPDSRARYEGAMARVASGIAKAAAAQPADGNALGVLSERVQTYAALVEQARSNNRLGLPVGAQYLTQASAGLRSDAIPIVEQVVKANEERSQKEFDRSNSSLQLLVGVVSLAGLVAIAVWLARRTHRYLNVSLTSAIGLLLVALFVTATTITGIGRATRDVAQGDFQSAVTLANVTTAANDARANESLTLIKRGSGAANETSWKTDRTTVETDLGRLSDTTLDPLWSDYVASHEKVRSLDNGGRWDEAVKLSTSTATGGAAKTFGDFDVAVTRARDDAGKTTVSSLNGLGGSAPLIAVAVALAALAASWLITRGIGQRIEEYR
ncbi:hypothetical protein GCM10009868_08950 [Terrabacter aerolatus]|uniref:Chemotaxis methyl-accepting receptor HlyB-like 4HB MCP domain-containing protein n=1 Tax=Terrabacter aerolatus TaxID=422442 RepID=A0A512D4K1_9MICO|nr:hypothetical protein [Terrabacter aerolatus]GEO31379.1 hypothetical protein TAE01_31890 [Terrabacter aerolatus]